MRFEAASGLSVVIVSWNTSELLCRCLTSLQQELAGVECPTEIIVVDNASTDGSVAMTEATFPGVRVIPLAENPGYAAAANLGMDKAAGEAVLICNADILFLPGSIGHLWAGLHAAEHIGMVAPLLLNPDFTVQSAGYRFPGAAQSFFDLLPLPARLMNSSLNGRISQGDGVSPIAIDHPLGACLLVQRRVIEQTNGMDASYFMYSEEIDWCRRIHDMGWTILLVPSAHVVHYGGQSTSQVADEMFLQLHRSRARYLRTYAPSWSLPATRFAAQLAAARSALKRDSERATLLRKVASMYISEAEGDGQRET